MDARGPRYKAHTARVIKSYNLPKDEIDRTTGQMSMRISAIVKTKGNYTAFDCGGNARANTKYA